MSLTAWTWDPAVLLGIAVAGGLYARGWRHLKRRSTSRAVLFASGLGLVLLALCSPIGTYDQDLFSLHMVEHLLLTIGAPPLLLLGKPLLPWLWGLPQQERRGVAKLIGPTSLAAQLGTLLADPKVALTLYVSTFAFWHVPTLYDAAQGQSLVHYLEHLTFFVTAIFFWWPVIHPTGGTRSLSKVASIGYFSVPMFESTLIGALLTFANRAFYATYAQAPRLSSLSAVDDQQLAGLIMWIPGGLVYVAAILGLLASVLREEDELADADLRRAQVPEDRRNLVLD